MVADRAAGTKHVAAIGGPDASIGDGYGGGGNLRIPQVDGPRPRSSDHTSKAIVLDKTVIYEYTERRVDREANVGTSKRQVLDVDIVDADHIERLPLEPVRRRSDSVRQRIGSTERDMGPRNEHVLFTNSADFYRKLIRSSIQCLGDTLSPVAIHSYCGCCWRFVFILGLRGRERYDKEAEHCYKNNAIHDESPILIVDELEFAVLF